MNKATGQQGQAQEEGLAGHTSKHVHCACLTSQRQTADKDRTAGRMQQLLNRPASCSRQDTDHNSSQESCQQHPLISAVQAYTPA